MKYKIVGDSCCDFTAEDLKKEYISRVPLILTVGDTDVIDDDTFDQEKYLDMVDRCRNALVLPALHQRIICSILKVRKMYL